MELVHDVSDRLAGNGQGDLQQGDLQAATADISSIAHEESAASPGAPAAICFAGQKVNRFGRRVRAENSALMTESPNLDPRELLVYVKTAFDSETKKSTKQDMECKPCASEQLARAASA